MSFLENCQNKKKLLINTILVVFGIFLSLFIVEGALQISGIIIRSYLDEQEDISFDANEIRILCIGESTTQLGLENSYPSQLSRILNDHDPEKKYIIINKGMTSKLSGDILMELDENLRKYKPHIVVAMIGVNDMLLNLEPQEESWSFLKGLRTYRLFSMIRKHWGAKKNSRLDGKKGKGNTPQQVEGGYLENLLRQYNKSSEILKRLSVKYVVDQNKEERKKLGMAISKLKIQRQWVLIVIGREYRLRGDYGEAEKYLSLCLEESGDVFGAYLELGRCAKEKGEYEQALELFQKAIAIYPDTILAHAELGRTYRAMGRDKELFNLAKQYVDKNLQDVWLYLEMGLSFKEQGRYKEAEKAYLQAIKFNPEDPEPYIQIADLYDLQGKEDIADAYSQKGIELKNELWEYPDFTVRNYQEIAERILFNKVHLICMQYPLRDGNSLKNIFLPWQQENIIFVDNKANFKHALKKNEYSKYFSDAFAGDFGHCTREGNRLIAENLAGVVLEKARGLRMGQEEIEKMGKVRE